MNTSHLISSLFLTTFFCTILSSCALAPQISPSLVEKSWQKQNILVIGHRGASGYRPEHTIESYALAIEMGADYIEPDLVMTKDGVLIARHENEISETTDAEIKFPKRKRTKMIDGLSVTGWFTEDLTLKEIKTLKAHERLSSRGQAFNVQFQIPTFAEILAFVQKKNKETNRVIGIYPEVKHPAYFSSIGLALEPALAKELKRVGLNKLEDPVIIQSFELASLRNLKSLVDCKLVYLLDENVRVSASELKDWSTFLYGIGPYKRLIIPAGPNGELLPATSLVSDAHKVGLKVHPYTFRSDAQYLAKEYKGDPLAEYRQFYALGVDGVFSDFPDQAVQARD